MAIRTPLLALLLLAACDGNPFPGGAGGGGGGSSGGSSVDLPGTTNPSSSRSISRHEDLNKGPGGTVTGNGFAEGIKYDAANDTFTVDNLAFDGGNVYQRDVGKPTVGPAQAYAADTTYADDNTGVLIDQFSYRALYGVSKTGRTNFAIVRTGAYIPYGFGGFVYNRTGGVVLPKSGQANYSGTYAGLRDFNNVTTAEPKLEYTTGDMNVAVDFNDFNPSATNGTGRGVQGFVTNRHIFDLNGNDITGTVVAEINKDQGLKGAGKLLDLPSLNFTVGPDVLDNNGEAEAGVTSTVPTSTGSGTTLESGKYYAVISGDNADELVGVLVVTSTVNGTETRETGGFILYRP